jgi:hypothetical protein
VESEVRTFAQVLTIIAVFASTMVALFFAARFLWNRTSRSALPAPRLDDGRFQRLEETVDTIALEVERMSEAQRFTAKLLLERGTDAAQAQVAQPKIPESIVTRR